MQKDNISEVLEQRGNDYGDFVVMCENYMTINNSLRNALKSITLDYKRDNCLSLVIDMWAVKLARLQFKETPDSILDLQGYTRLLIQNIGIKASQRIFEILQEVQQHLTTKVCFKSYESLNNAFKKELEAYENQKEKE